MAATRELEAIYESLADRPQHFSDLCCGVSRPLLSALIEQIPRDSLVLSVGCGTGLLEALLLRHGDGSHNILGVEVPSCEIKYLAEDRTLRVLHDRDMHPAAVEHGGDVCLLFVYPRTASLITRYIRGFTCALSSHRSERRDVVVISHQTELADVAAHLDAAFENVHIINATGFLPDYEFLVVASSLKSGLTVSP